MWENWIFSGGTHYHNQNGCWLNDECNPLRIRPWRKKNRMYFCFFFKSWWLLTKFLRVFHTYIPDPLENCSTRATFLWSWFHSLNHLCQHTEHSFLFSLQLTRQYSKKKKKINNKKSLVYSQKKSNLNNLLFTIQLHWLYYCFWMVTTIGMRLHCLEIHLRFACTCCSNNFSQFSRVQPSIKEFI